MNSLLSDSNTVTTEQLLDDTGGVDDTPSHSQLPEELSHLSSPVFAYHTSTNDYPSLFNSVMLR